MSEVGCGRRADYKRGKLAAIHSMIEKNSQLTKKKADIRIVKAGHK